MELRKTRQRLLINAIIGSRAECPRKNVHKKNIGLELLFF